VEALAAPDFCVSHTKESVLDPKIRQSWEEFLNPEVMRPRLIAASIYIAGFEALKDSIVGRIREFFWNRLMVSHLE